jgi:hypothetical protein
MSARKTTPSRIFASALNSMLASHVMDALASRGGNQIVSRTVKRMRLMGTFID